MDLRTLVLYIHLLALAVALIGVVVADKIGFGWLSGKQETVDLNTSHRLHVMMSVALTTSILTGLYLFWPSRNYLLHQNLFLLKMLFVAALVINSLVIDKLMKIATTMPFARLSIGKKLAFIVSGGVSFVCWLATPITAYLLFGWLF